MKDTILIVEDSKSFMNIITRRLAESGSFEPVPAYTFAQAREALESGRKFFLALLDLNLPDSGHGEVVDLVRAHGIPIIVATGDISDEVQEFIWSKNVVDYVIKEGPHTIDYVISLIERVARNRTTKILVVDDSKAARSHVRTLLETHLYQVLEALDGASALELLEKEEGIKLAIVDYTMPGMDGVELTRKIRYTFPMDRLGIIGLSSYGNHKLSVNFIKHGANDFIAKPFVSEQLYCRVTQNINLIEHFDTIRELSNTDYLTRIYNRRYLFSVGAILLNNALRNLNYLSVAMIDIDHFKKVNDTYGHESGDQVLIQLAELLRSSFRDTDVVSRFGGEEFCVLTNNAGPAEAMAIFEKLRAAVERMKIRLADDTEISVTVSIGVCSSLMDTLNDMIVYADKKLYEAKYSGRNRVIF